MFIIKIQTVSAQNFSQSNSVAIFFQKSISYFPAKNKMEGNVFGGELIYKISTVDKPIDWVKKLKVKSIDFIFDYKNLNNLKVTGFDHTFGESYSALVGLNMRLAHLNSVNFNLLPAVGFGYSSKSNTTSQNPLIGSHLNFFAKIGFEVESNIAKKTTVSVNVDVFHFSNAALKLPNLGANMSNIGIGISRKFNQPKKIERDTLGYQVPAYKKHHLELGINFGKRGVDGGGNKGLYKNGAYLGYNYSINPVVDLGLGIDAVYYYKVYDIIAYRSTNQSLATSFDRWRLGFAFGPALNLGKLNFSTRYGYYLHFNNPQNGKDYWTFAIKYGLTSWVAAETKLYVHKLEADYIGLGFSFLPFH